MRNTIRPHGLAQHPFDRKSMPSSRASILSRGPRTQIRSEAQCQVLCPLRRLTNVWKSFLQPATDRKDTVNIPLAYQKREIDGSFIPGHAPGEPLRRHALPIKLRWQLAFFLFPRDEKTKVVETIRHLSLRPLL